MSHKLLILLIALLTGGVPALGQSGYDEKRITGELNERRSPSSMSGTVHSSEPILFPAEAKGRYILKKDKIAWEETHTHLQVFSAGGKLLHEETLQPQIDHFDLSSFQKGIYFLKFHNGNRVFINKIEIDCLPGE